MEAEQYRPAQKALLWATDRSTISASLRDPIAMVKSLGDTEVSQPIHVSVCRQSTLCLFPDEARSLFVTISKRWLRLPDELVLLGYPIADSSKWTAPRHATFLLQLDVGGEPPFEILLEPSSLTGWCPVCTPSM